MKMHSEMDPYHSCTSLALTNQQIVTGILQNRTRMDLTNLTVNVKKERKKIYIYYRVREVLRMDLLLMKLKPASQFPSFAVLVSNSIPVPILKNLFP